MKPHRLKSLILKPSLIKALVLIVSLLSAFSFFNWLNFFVKTSNGLSGQLGGLFFFSVLSLMLFVLWMWLGRWITTLRVQLILAEGMLIDQVSYFWLGQIDLRHVHRIEIVRFFSVSFLYFGLKPSVWKGRSLSPSSTLFRWVFFNEIWLPLSFFEQSWAEIQSFVEQVRIDIPKRLKEVEKGAKRKPIPQKPKGPPKLPDQSFEETKTSFVFKMSTVIDLQPSLPPQSSEELSGPVLLSSAADCTWICDLYMDHLRYFKQWKLDSDHRLPPQVELRPERRSEQFSEFLFKNKLFCFSFDRSELQDSGGDELWDLKLEFEGDLVLHLRTVKLIGALELKTLELLSRGPWIEDLRELSEILVSPRIFTGQSIQQNQD